MESFIFQRLLEEPRVKIENKHNHLELGQDAIVGCKMQVASEMKVGPVENKGLQSQIHKGFYTFFKNSFVTTYLQQQITPTLTMLYA